MVKSELWTNKEKTSERYTKMQRLILTLQYQLSHRKYQICESLNVKLTKT